MSVNTGKQRNRSNNTLVWIMCGIIMMMAITPFLLKVSADSGNPGWQEGESWAMGYEEDLSFDFDYEEFLRKILGDELDMEESELENFKVTSDGIVGMYIISEVVETSPQYKIKTTTSFGLDWKITFEMTGQFYRAGHYENVTEDEDGDWDVPKERQTMTIVLDCEAALLANGFEYREAQSLAILKQTYSMETACKVTMEAVNWINEDEGWSDYDWETGKETLDTLDIRYNDFSMDWSWEADADITAIYSPGIESQPPSENIGDLWNLTYAVTTSGTYDGYVKVSLDGNLPDMEEDDFLNYERYDLQDPVLSSPPFVEGEIQETTEIVTLQQEIVGKEYVTMADGSSVECIVYKEHEIEDEYDDEYDDESDDDFGYYDDAAASYYFYSPTHHRIVRFQTEYLSEDELYSEIPYSSVNLTPVTVDQAQEFNKKHADPSAIGSSEDSSLNYFFISGIIIVISIIGIGAFIHMQRRSSGADTGYADAFNQPYDTGQTMGQGYTQSPGTFQQPIQSGYQAGGQDGYQSKYQTGCQTGYQNAQCPWCYGTAVYYPSHNQHFCTSCHRSVPVQTAQQSGHGQANQYQQQFQQPIQQSQFQQQSYAPRTGQWQDQQFQLTQQHSTTASYQQQQTAAQAPGQGKYYCKDCGDSLIYTPQYSRYYCMKCQTFR